MLRLLAMSKLHYLWGMFDADVTKLALQVRNSGWQPDYIVGLVRGGAVVAVALSHRLNCLMYTADVRLRDTYNGYQGPEFAAFVEEDVINGKRVLIVDDINDSGATFQWIESNWCLDGYGSEGKDLVRYAALFDHSGSKFAVDYSIHDLPADSKPWVVFPWEY